MVASSLSPMGQNTSDPATWAAASVEADLSHMDSLEDVLMEAATTALLNSSVAAAPKKLVRIVAGAAMLGIEKAREAGLLESDDNSIFSPRYREFTARLLAEIIDAPNARLHAQCVDFVFELGIQMGLSQTEIGKSHNMTRANVSKICVEIRKRYGVRPSRGMKSVKACENYAIRQMGRRAKPVREEWSLAASLKSSIYGTN
jgi:hypothetical protein